MSWRLLTLSAISLFSLLAGRCPLRRRHAASFSSWGSRPALSITWRSGRRHSLALLALRVADSERLQLAVKRRALHPDEIGGSRDVAREAADLDPQIFALERLARCAKRGSHDRLDRLPRAEAGLLVEQFG